MINTGSTILSCNDRFTASYRVLGGAPGTRETDLLEPDKLVEKIDALVLSGGSAFGLEAASEIVNLLRKDNKGYEVGNNKIPIVPGAIIFDLMNGGEKSWDKNPYIDLFIGNAKTSGHFIEGDDSPVKDNIYPSNSAIRHKFAPRQVYLAQSSNLPSSFAQLLSPFRSAGSTSCFWAD